jgi:hypothetical protein
MVKNGEKEGDKDLSVADGYFEGELTPIWL